MAAEQAQKLAGSTSSNEKALRIAPEGLVHEWPKAYFFFGCAGVTGRGAS
jgi:hypothetical protein